MDVPFKVSIVCFSGKQGSGKDTTALALKQLYSHDFDTACYVVKFADVIYEMQSAVYDVAMKYDMFDEKPAKDGRLLQLLGTEWGREKRESIWVDACVGKINKMVADINRQESVPKRVVFMITDCRFENEFKSMRDAFRVRLECSEEIRKTRAESWRDATDHPSETGLDEWAAMGLFDLILDTNRMSAEKCALEISSHLAKSDWHKYRSHSV